MAVVVDLNRAEVAQRVVFDHIDELGVEYAVVERDGVLPKSGDRFAEDLAVDQKDRWHTTLDDRSVRLLIAQLGLSFDLLVVVVEGALDAHEGDAEKVDEISQLSREEEKWEDRLNELDLLAGDSAVCQVGEQSHG